MRYAPWLLTVMGAIAIPALATPYIDISSKWYAAITPTYFAPNTPSVSITCGGDTVTFPLGCGSYLTLNQSFAADASGTISDPGSMTITANSPTGIFSILLDAAPILSPIGIAIDTITNQNASFTSRADINASGNGLNLSVSCSLPAPQGYNGTGGYVFSPTSCGENAPDESTTIVYASLDTGQSLTLNGLLSISYFFDPPPIPEPTSFLLLGIGVVGIGLMQRRT